MTAAPVERTDQPLYLYGFVLHGSPVPPDVTGVHGEPVRLEHAGEVDALVSPMPAEEAVGLPAEVRAHSTVLDSVARQCAVLPVRFGTVVPDVGSLADEVATEGDRAYVGELHRLADLVQLSLRVRYVQDVVMAELVDEDPAIRQLRESTRTLSEEASYYDRVRLGELVVAGFDRKRSTDAVAVEEAIAPHVVEMLRRDNGDVDDVLSVAMLVRRSAVGEVEDALEDLAARHADRMTFRLVGPQAPYDFVAGA